jgi:hypothetical protein
VSREVGIVVNIANWKATVHYLDCLWYRRAQHTCLPLPRKIKVRLCLRCRPTEQAIRAAPPEVSWYAWSPVPGGTAKVVRMDIEHAENYAARRSMGYGKKLTYREGWS